MRTPVKVSVANFNVVIPARFGSTRLPGKPLIDLGGRCMVLRVAHQARGSGANEVVVATDHADIAQAVSEAGFDAEMTSAEHVSGSDRVMEVAARRGWPGDAIVINVQGDEPLIPPAVIRQLGEALTANPALSAATLCEVVNDPREFSNPNVVKVVRRPDNQALYFSRAPIPHLREPLRDAVSGPPGWLRHVGVYAFRVEALRRFVALPASPLEQAERLEQLRLLDNGIALAVFDACEPVPAGVDTPEDVARVRALLAAS